jgi:hypothetical protein
LKTARLLRRLVTPHVIGNRRIRLASQEAPRGGAARLGLLLADDPHRLVNAVGVRRRLALGIPEAICKPHPL